MTFRTLNEHSPIYCVILIFITAPKNFKKELMKTKRILSALLGLLMVLTLLPTAAFAATAEIKDVAVTVSDEEVCL